MKRPASEFGSRPFMMQRAKGLLHGAQSVHSTSPIEVVVARLAEVVC
jgi:hypothetical protein